MARSVRKKTQELEQIRRYLNQQSLIAERHKAHLPYLVHRTNANINLFLMEQAIRRHEQALLAGGMSPILNSAKNVGSAALNTAKSVASSAIAGTGRLASSAIAGTGRLASSAIAGTGRLASSAITGTGRLASSVLRQSKNLANSAYDATRTSLRRTNTGLSPKDKRKILETDIDHYNFFDQQIRKHLKERYEAVLDKLPKNQSIWTRLRESAKGMIWKKQQILQEIFAVMTCIATDQSHENVQKMHRVLNTLNHHLKHPSSLKNKTFSVMLRNLYQHLPITLPEFNRGCSPDTLPPRLQTEHLLQSGPMQALVGNIHMSDKEFNQLLYLLLRIAHQDMSSADEMTSTAMKANPKFLQVKNEKRIMSTWQVQMIVRWCITNRKLSVIYFLLAVIVQLINKYLDRSQSVALEIESYNEFQSILTRVGKFAERYVPSLFNRSLLDTLTMHLKNAEVYFYFMKLDIQWNQQKTQWKQSNASEKFMVLMHKIENLHYLYSNTFHQHRYSKSYVDVLNKSPENLIELLLQASTFSVDNADLDKDDGDVVEEIQDIFSNTKYHIFREKYEETNRFRGATNDPDAELDEMFGKLPPPVSNKRKRARKGIYSSRSSERE